jgi:endonuclease III
MASEGTDHPPFSPLIADVLTAMTADSQATTNALIEGLTARATRAEAALDAVRDQVMDLLSGTWMPTPAAIQRALWPSELVVDKFRKLRDAGAREVGSDVR